MPESNPSRSAVRERSVVFPVLIATFLTNLIVSSLVIFGEIMDPVEGLVFGCANFFLALPFTLLTVLLYRKTKLPARLELLAATLAGIAGTGLANWLLF